MSSASNQHRVPWDWEAQARNLGVSQHGEYNGASARFAKERALIWIRSDGSRHNFTGADVRRQAKDLAGVLHRAGIRPRDRVAGLMNRRPEGFTVPLAAWTLGAIYVPLFSGFSGEGLSVRLEDCGPKLVVTDTANYGSLASLAGTEFQIVVVDGDPDESSLSLPDLLNRDLPPVTVATTGLHDPATIMYTSGTTGKPKGCIIPHRAVLNLLPFVIHCLDLTPSQTLFSGADPGWSFGLYTTGFAPLTQGASRIIYEGGFDPADWWSVIDRFDSVHLAAAPTAFRQFVKAGSALVSSKLSAATSAGEPMDPPTMEWFREHVGVGIHDGYGLTELGMVTANLRNPPRPQLVAGSMGIEVPGFEVELRDHDGSPIDDDRPGHVAVRDNGYFLSSGYWERMSEWKDRFDGDWFITEDIATRDSEGRYWHVGRADDVIVTSGYNVGPGEIEAALMAHPLVTDAACVARADELRGNIVVAYVVLSGAPPNDLSASLRQWVGKRVGWHAAPREVHVEQSLPRTASGKTQRRLLREQGTEGRS